MDAELTFRSDETLTADEFFDWVQQRPAYDVNHYELIQGRIVMTPPANMGHGRRDSWLSHKFWEVVERGDLGVVFGSSTGFRLPNGDVLEPDVAFVSKERLAAASEQDENYFARVVPDLVVEILSPSTARRDRTEKKDIYAANGVREYWLVDGKRREVAVFHLQGDAHGSAQILSAGVIESSVLTGLRVSIDELFRN